MRITILTTGLFVGGAETQIARLAPYLKENLNDIVVVSLQPLGPISERLIAEGISVYSLGIPATGSQFRRFFALLFGIGRLVRLLRAHRPDALVSFMYHANLLGRVIGRALRVPVIISSVRNERFGGPIRELLIKVTNFLSDTTVVNSELARKGLVARGILRDSGSTCIRNAIGVPSGIAKYSRASFDIPDSAFLWVCVGRLEPQKDYPTLIDALVCLDTFGDDWHLVIAGDGSLREDIARLIAARQLSDRVHLLGRRNDVPEILAIADGFVLSSAWEGLPNVVMEAMLAGLPVVSTAVGGVAELVQEGDTGYLCRSRDAGALANAMGRLMRDSPTRRMEMGLNGRCFIESEFGVQQIGLQWLSLIGEHHASGRS